MSILLSPARALPIGLILGVLTSTVTAQLEFGGTPCPDDLLGEVVVPSTSLAAPDVAALIEEDNNRPKGAFRFGVVREVNVGVQNGGVWQTLPNGDRVWRVRITSQGAFSLSPEFSEFTLPEGAQLFVYNDNRETVRGAYTSANNKPNGQFAIQPTAGDAITIEYLEPQAVKGQGLVQIANVVHDYRDFLGHGAAAGDGGACNVDVNCSQGNPWRNQINSVIGVTQGGWICTASLINNSANDGRQLVMSANHCGSYNNAVFLFNYQRSGCNSGASPRNESVQGSQLLATAGFGDYRLIELLEPIPASFNAYYNGWNRSSTVPTNTLCVHHPSGCPKKISFDNDPPTRAGQYWRVNDWDLGTTEGGSSGSPLMDQNGRFIGQLCCGLAACGNNFSDDYGALNTYWNSVSQYLDPLNTGAMTIGGLDPNVSCPSSIASNATSRNGSGVNPTIYSQSTPAVIGQTWVTTVDMSGFSGAHTFQLLSSAPDAGSTLGGPFVGELLCQNPVVVGLLGIGQHAVQIPPNCAIAGATLHSQIVVQTATTLEFTNALDITLGTF